MLSFVVSNCVKDFFPDADALFDLMDADRYLEQVIGFSGKTEKEWKESLWKNINSIHAFFNSHLKIKLSVSIGSLFSKEEGLADSYEQARDFIFQVIDSNMESGRRSAQLARCMLFGLVGTIIKGLSLTRRDNSFLGRLNPVERLLQCETFEMMKSELSDILKRVCDYIIISTPTKRIPIKGSLR